MRLKFCLLCSLSTLLLSAAALLVAGCGNTEHDSTLDVVYNPCEPLNIEVQGEADADQLASVDEALAMWNQLAPVALNREAADAATTIPVRFESGAPMLHGYYEDETGEVIINRSLSDERARAITVAHELGHAFGLRHVAAKKRSSLMNSGNLDTGLTDADADALLLRWNDCAAAM
ncbi:MAG: DUF6782 family putative metallopeptidase [Persicimonas sp.]